MQYLLHDLIKLPLNERLTIIEKAINSISFNEVEQDIKNYKHLSLWHAKSIELSSEKAVNI